MADTGPFHLDTWFHEASRNAEAGATLIAVAIVDDWLQRLLLVAMRKISNAVAERIFDSYGPLYELAPKADIAYAFELIDDETLATIRVLRDVRNKFAHTRDVLHFDHAEILALCKKLPAWSDTEAVNNQARFNVIAFKCIRKIDEKTGSIVFEKAARP